MNKAELKKRISEVLGVSSTQSETAYEIFLEKLSKFLNFGITLKVPRIGFFQLKDNFEDNPQKILFASLPEDYTTSSKNFYLTLELHNKSKNNIEIDSQIFSIGVGKPLLPLVNEDSERQSEISFEILKKSIEERAKELLSESDQIPNFNIWDEFIYEDNDENLFDNDSDANQMVIENEIDTNENLIDKLLSQTDFTIENDFNEVEKQNEIIDQVFNEEISNINLTIPDSISVDSLLEDEIEIQDKNEIEKINVETTDNDINAIDTKDTNEKIKHISTFADELKNQIDELEKISNEIIGDKNYIEDKEENKDELKSKTENEDIVSLQIGEDYSQDIKSTVFENDINTKSENDEINLSTLLDDEQKNIIENQINIKPPAASKEFIIDEFILPNNDIINIEENELKQIVQNEIDNLNKNYNEENNSDVLNKLLTEEQLKKIDVDENDNDNEQNQPEEKIANKIEWNWGDELREEFGLGNLENIEVVEANKSDEVIENKFEFIDEDIPENYEDSPTIELRKTRVDLFTKLEETLEREINFLKQDVVEKEEEIIFEKPEVNDNYDKDIIHSENQNDNSSNEIELKDEKVILDFKTPPPQYEFIKENPVENKTSKEIEVEPLLKPPKKITIILSPEEQENLIEKKTITKTLDNSQTEIEIIQQPKEKKNYWKLISIILGSLLILSVTSFFVFKFFNTNNQISKSNNNQTLNTDKPQDELNKNQNLSFTENQTQNTTDALAVEEYSDFPITATPPKPIKSGNELNVQQLIPKTEKVETKTITPVEKRNETSNIALNKNQAKETKVEKGNKTVEKLKTQNEVRLSSMIFFDGKNYSFQTSSWKNKSLAEIEMSRLRSLGFNAFLSEAYLPQKGGTWYRVRIGYFNSEQEALEFKKKNNF